MRPFDQYQFVFANAQPLPLREGPFHVKIPVVSQGRVVVGARPKIQQPVKGAHIPPVQHNVVVRVLADIDDAQGWVQCIETDLAVGRDDFDLF